MDVSLISAFMVEIYSRFVLPSKPKNDIILKNIIQSLSDPTKRQLFVFIATNENSLFKYLPFIVEHVVDMHGLLPAFAFSKTMDRETVMVIIECYYKGFSKGSIHEDVKPLSNLLCQ